MASEEKSEEALAFVYKVLKEDVRLTPKQLKEVLKVTNCDKKEDKVCQSIKKSKIV